MKARVTARWRAMYIASKLGSDFETESDGVYIITVPDRTEDLFSLVAPLGRFEVLPTSNDEKGIHYTLDFQDDYD
jgi:hypothetical protein